MLTKITKKVVAPTAGTPVSLSDGEEGTIVEIAIIGLPSNTGDTYLGYTGVSAADEIGIPLAARDVASEDDDLSAMNVTGRKLEDLLIDVENNGEGVSVVGLLRTRG